ncbi:MAG: esterase family protein [Lachnospiraceae bacterium]|nr:esterase family protein [Lachnospiraceae bacterium]
MAFIKMNLKSECLGMNTNVGVFMPKLKNDKDEEEKYGFGERAFEPGMKYQVMWLIDGGCNNFFKWYQYTNITKEAQQNSFITISPMARDYTSMRKAGGDYFHYITEELPELMRFLLPASPNAEDNFIIGASFGGYFAYRCALSHPETYGYVGAVGGPLDVVYDLKDHRTPHTPKAEDVPGSDLDLFTLLKRLQDSGRPVPKMFHSMGNDDFTWEANINARRIFQEMGVQTKLVTGPGAHNWDPWQGFLEEFVKWLPLKRGPFWAEED